MNPKDFKAQINDQSVDFYVLENEGQMRVCLSNYGARILSIEVPDKQGQLKDVTLGYGSLEAHRQGLPYFGALIGRCANRIGMGRFQLDGTTYQLSQNIAPNHLHGGINSFSHQVWTPFKYTRDTLELQYISPDREEGYPGQLTTTVRFQLSAHNELIVEMQSQSDTKTIVNLTTHPFFNLEGEDYPDVLQHQLYINANSYLAMSEDFLPDNKVKVSEDSVFDFRMPKSIGQDIQSSHAQLRLARGYDHNYILNTTDAHSIAASVYAPCSGIQMDVYTNQPGMQLYTGNWLDGTDKGKSGHVYHKHAAVCLEPQHFPNSPNRPDFPSIALAAGETYYHYTKFGFGVRE